MTLCQYFTKEYPILEGRGGSVHRASEAPSYTTINRPSRVFRDPLSI